MAHADALSRGPIGAEMDTMDEIIESRLDVLAVFTTKQHVAMMQQSNEDIRRSVAKKIECSISGFTMEFYTNE